MIGFLRIFFKENNPVLVGVHVSWKVLCYLADFPTISPSPNEQHYGMDIGKRQMKIERWSMELHIRASSIVFVITISRIFHHRGWLLIICWGVGGCCGCTNWKIAALLLNQERGGAILMGKPSIREIYITSFFSNLQFECFGKSAPFSCVFSSTSRA